MLADREPDGARLPLRRAKFSTGRAGFAAKGCRQISFQGRQELARGVLPAHETVTGRAPKPSRLPHASRFGYLSPGDHVRASRRQPIRYRPTPPSRTPRNRQMHAKASLDYPLRNRAARSASSNRSATAGKGRLARFVSCRSPGGLARRIRRNRPVRRASQLVWAASLSWDWISRDRGQDHRRLAALDGTEGFLPRDTGSAPRLVRQMVSGKPPAFIRRTVAVIDDEHSVVRPLDLLQAVVVIRQLGVGGEFRGADLVGPSRLLNISTRLFQVNARWN